jgi:predicted permease
VAWYLAIKLLLLPWLMVGVTRALGVGGRDGLALLLLTAVPVSMSVCGV